MLTLPDSIAWLLNLRGADVARTPVALAFAILHADGAVDLVHRPGQGRARGRGLARAAGPPAAAGRVRARARPRSAGGSPSTRPARRSGSPTGWRQPGPRWSGPPTPACCPRPARPPAEIAGARAAHLRDGAAMAEFLCWLDATAPEGGLSEIDVVRRLEAIRAATGALRDIAFDTICGAGPNGAIVHYRVSEASNRPVRPGELLLVDSGAQYPDGTTDVTRTVAVGAVPPERQGAVHRGAEGADRDEPARLARGAVGTRHRRGGAGRAVAGRARLRPRHRARGRQLPRRARGPGRPVAALDRAAAPGHDPVDRAGLLPRGRVRHPHREPRGGARRPRRRQAATGRCWAGRR